MNVAETAFNVHHQLSVYPDTILCFLQKTAYESPANYWARQWAEKLPVYSRSCPSFTCTLIIFCICVYFSPYLFIVITLSCLSIYTLLFLMFLCSTSRLWFLVLHGKIKLKTPPTTCYSCLLWREKNKNGICTTLLTSKKFKQTQMPLYDVKKMMWMPNMKTSIDFFVSLKGLAPLAHWHKLLMVYVCLELPVYFIQSTQNSIYFSIFLCILCWNVEKLEEFPFNCCLWLVNYMV